MNGHLEFVDAGAGVSIQDGGRSGHRDIGVPLSAQSVCVAAKVLATITNNGEPHQGTWIP